MNEHRLKKIYLAGPDVFFRNANISRRCRRAVPHSGCGGRPSDGGLSQSEPGAQGSGDEIAQRIYAANVAPIRNCDTVLEVGMAVALGKPVAGFVHDVDLAYEDKVARVCGLQRDATGLAWDASHGFMIEAFGQPMNLMLSCSTALFGSADEALAHLAALWGPTSR